MCLSLKRKRRVIVTEIAAPLQAQTDAVKLPFALVDAVENRSFCEELALSLAPAGRDLRFYGRIPALAAT